MTAPSWTPPPPRHDLKWLGVDLDGTLAEPVWRYDDPSTWATIGEPISENVDKLRRAVAAGYKPWIHTSRPWSDYEMVESWLRFHQVPYKEIAMGKPLFAAYIDDRAIRAEEVSWIPSTH